MFKKMLVLLDGSKLAEVVFIYAQELAGRLGLDLELLHVCTPQEAEQMPMRQAYMEHMAEILQKKALEISRQSGAKADGEKLKAKGTVVVGYPAVEILKYVENNQIDLVMLSTHGRSGINAWDLGSVASKVIHASTVPIWVVPSELKEEIMLDQIPGRQMVIPLDGTKMAEGVIPYAIELAKQRGGETEITLLSVQDRSYSGISVMEQLKTIESERLQVQRYLEEKVKMIQAEGISVRYELLDGNPASTIIKYVKENPAQLIAMATHGHSGISRMIFGSVTENILNLVKKTPIFLVKPQE